MSDTPPPPGEDSPGTDATGGSDPSETVSLPTTQPQPADEPPADAGVVSPPEPPAPTPPPPADAAPAPAPADPYAAPPAAGTGHAAAGYAAAAPGYPPTQPQPGYPPPGGPGQVGYPPAGGYGPPAAGPSPAGPPPTQAGWGAGGGAVPPAYGAPPPAGGSGGGKKALMIVLIVVGVLFLGLVALALIGFLAGDDDDAPTVDRTTITTPTTAPPFDPDTTEGPSPGDSALDGTTTTGGGGPSIDVFDLEVGDCFDVPSDGNISEVEGIDCDAPHDNEVFALFDIAGGPDAPFPGAEAISRQAQAECTGTRFSDYVGVPFPQSSFSATSINPTRETWERLDDREVICVITGGDGETLTSSARNANR